MDQLLVAEANVVQAALSLTASRLWADLHPDDPHGADEIDMKREQLDTMIGVYAHVRNS